MRKESIPGGEITEIVAGKLEVSMLCGKGLLESWPDSKGLCRDRCSWKYTHGKVGRYFLEGLGGRTDRGSLGPV